MTNFDQLILTQSSCTPKLFRIMLGIKFSHWLGSEMRIENSFCASRLFARGSRRSTIRMFQIFGPSGTGKWCRNRRHQEWIDTRTRNKQKPNGKTPRRIGTSPLVTPLSPSKRGNSSKRGNLHDADYEPESKATCVLLQNFICVLPSIHTYKPSSFQDRISVLEKRHKDIQFSSVVCLKYVCIITHLQCMQSCCYSQDQTEYNSIVLLLKKLDENMHTQFKALQNEFGKKLDRLDKRVGNMEEL